MTDESSLRNRQSQSMTEAYQDSSSVVFLPNGITKIAVYTVLLLLLSSSIVLGGLTLTTPSDTSPPETAPEAPDTAIVSEVNYSTVYNETTPSVVSVYSNGENGTSSQGSGFVYDSNNHIVTNWHVINSGEEVYVRYSNGEWSKATVIGSDAYTDLAVLQVDSKPESAEPLPVSNTKPRVGSQVLALGSPDNLRGSLSAGTISGVNRSMTTPQGFVIPDMVQTDASLNPGNSGGPLVGMDGTVLGANRARQGENLGFAISGRIMNTVVPSLIDNGEHKHSLVGIRGTTMTPDIANGNDMTLRSGILITDVVDTGPSDGKLEGGSGETIPYKNFEVAKGGDVLIAINGHQINTNEALTSYLMRETQPGDTVEFTILRDGETKTVEVTLGERSQYGG